MNIKKIFKKLSKRKPEKKSGGIINLYNTEYQRHVLICYITSPFHEGNNFMHQNYVTSHIISESFSELGYNVDVVDYNDNRLNIPYEKYSVIFGFGSTFENSFYSAKRSISRVHFITGVHEALQNATSLESVRDFYAMSDIWLPNEAKVLRDNCYYAFFESDVSIILAYGFVFDDFKARFKNKLYSLNNNTLGVFAGFNPKIKSGRNTNFLYLSGVRQITKGLHILLEVARLRKDLSFHIVVHHLDKTLENYYDDLLNKDTNVFLHKSIGMDSQEMRQIIESCSYSIAPSYADGLPGGTIEPMSAGLIPIVSKYCGFAREQFIFEMDDLSPDGLNETINKVLELDDVAYVEYSEAVKRYAEDNFSQENVKKQLMEILRSEFP